MIVIWKSELAPMRIDSSIAVQKTMTLYAHCCSSMHIVVHSSAQTTTAGAASKTCTQKIPFTFFLLSSATRNQETSWMQAAQPSNSEL